MLAHDQLWNHNDHEQRKKRTRTRGTYDMIVWCTRSSCLISVVSRMSAPLINTRASGSGVIDTRDPLLLTWQCSGCNAKPVNTIMLPIHSLLMNDRMMIAYDMYVWRHYQYHHRSELSFPFCLTRAQYHWGRNIYDISSCNVTNQSCMDTQGMNYGNIR